MDKIKLIREACIKANPEIEELDFGCMVQKKHPIKKVKWAKILAHLGGGTYRVIERIDTSRNGEELRKDYGHCEFEEYQRRDFEIIGHPIRLADVLLAIQKRVEGDRVSCCGDNMIPAWQSFARYLLEKWNLKDNNLEKQSLETIDFIYELLT